MAHTHAIMPVHGIIDTHIQIFTEHTDMLRNLLKCLGNMGLNMK